MACTIVSPLRGKAVRRGGARLALGQRRLAIAAIVFLAAEAFALGPKYSGPPPTSVPATFKNARPRESGGAWKGAEPKDAISRGAWWSIFHDRMLDQLEEEAVRANQDLQLAVARIEEARSRTRIAAADFYPRLTFEPSGVRQRTSNTDPFQRGELIGNNPFGGLAGGGPAGGGAASPAAPSGPLVLDTQPLSRTYNVFRFPFDLNWELDLFGRVRKSKEAAKANAEALRADYQNTLLSSTAAVAADYFNLRSLDSELDVLDRTLKTRREALQIAGERLQAGLTSELDLTRARAEAASNEAEALAVARSRQEVENALATLLGRTASGFQLPRRPLTTLPPAVPAGLPSSLLERRPDIAAAERQLAASNARIGVATAAFFPQIRLTALAGLESAEVGRLFQWQSALWQFGASAVQPLFEGGRNTANLTAARAQYEQAAALYRKQALVAFQEVESALGDLRLLAAQADAQERATSAARRALELSQAQYQRGAVNFLDVLDAERTLLADERLNAQLLGQRDQATVQLVKALGGDWK